MQGGRADADAWPWCPPAPAAAVYPKATLYGADVLGGLILGAGIALAGACPGTVLAQIGAGYRDAWFTVLGGLLGALAFVYLEPALKPLLLTGGPGKLTFDQLLGIPFWLLAAVAALGIAGGLVALEKWRPWRDDLGADADGNFASGARSSVAREADGQPGRIAGSA